MAAALGPSVAAKGQQKRIERPEGYLEVEGDAGLSRGKGSYSVVPADKAPSDRGKTAVWHDEDSQSDDQSPPPAPSPSPRESCQPAAERFAGRLAVLRGSQIDAGAEPLDYAVQRAMFGRTALHAPGNDPDQPVPELTWDEELKDLYRAYQSCLKAAARRSR